MAFARKTMPLLDDWVDNKPDAWDFEAVLRANKVTVEWGDTMTVRRPGLHASSPARYLRLGLPLGAWNHLIGQTTETIARKAAALFVSLWLRGVSASFADKLMDGYISFLERQENESLTFLAEIKHTILCDVLRLTRRGFCAAGVLERLFREDHRSPGLPRTGRGDHRHVHQEEEMPIPPYADALPEHQPARTTHDPTPTRRHLSTRAT